MGPVLCLFEAKRHHQRVRQRTRIHAGNGKDTHAVQGLPTMVRPVPIVMPELKQRKQKEGKATGSRNDDSVSRRCRRRILLGQAPCALSKCFASTETRRHDVGQATSAQSSPSRSAALALVQNNGSLVLGQEIPGAGRRRALFTDARRRSARKCSRLGVVSQADRGALDPAALKVPLGLRRPRGLPGATDKTCLGRESSRALGHRHVSRTTAATWSGNCSFHAKPDQASAQHDPRGEVVETLHEPGGAGLRLLCPALRIICDGCAPVTC